MTLLFKARKKFQKKVEIWGMTKENPLKLTDGNSINLVKNWECICHSLGLKSLANITSNCYKDCKSSGLQ